MSMAHQPKAIQPDQESIIAPTVRLEEQECDEVPAEEYEGFLDKLKTQRDLRLQKAYTSENKKSIVIQADNQKGDDVMGTESSKRNQSYLSFVNSASFLKLNQGVRTASKNRLVGTQSMVSNHSKAKLSDHPQYGNAYNTGENFNSRGVKHLVKPSGEWKTKLFTKSSLDTLGINERAA